VKLHEGTIDAPARRCPSDDASNIDSWHEAEQPEESDPDQYGLGSDLYDTISAFSEVDSGKKQLGHFLDKLEMEFVNSIKAL
jgi:hypothetical protein